MLEYSSDALHEYYLVWGVLYSRLEPKSHVRLAYFTKPTRPGPGTSEKAYPGPLEKADSIPKFTVLVKDSYLTISRLLISNMTILFSNSNPKISKKGIFGPKFRHFCFFKKFCNETNLRVLISNTTIVF